MSNEVIMLAKGFSVPKIQFPCVVTEKLDGIAADFYVPKGSTTGKCLVRSRQNKPILSVQHIQDALTGTLRPGFHVICELYIPGMKFKDIGGLVRSHEPAPNLIAFIYDFYEEGKEHVEYNDRIIAMVAEIGRVVRPKDSCVRIINGKKCSTPEELFEYIGEFTNKNQEAEGMMIRSLRGEDSQYKFGRSWGMQKCKITDTADLKVVAFEEALSEDGTPKGMIGRIVVEVECDGSVITTGAGAGKMTHKERTEVFLNQDKYIGKIAEIAYMPDSSYAGGLREPRFHRWRFDKTKPSQE